MKVLIVGGVAVGASSLARLKRLLPDAHVIMFEKDEHVSFANCGLPYYLGGVIEERGKLIVQTKEALMDRTKGEVRPFSEVTKIDPILKTVTVLDKVSNKTYEESYDKLILGPGAYPFVPKVEGLELAKNVFTLRNVADVDKIEAYMNQGIQHVTIIGSGFIGVEMAENMIHKGYQVDVIELGKQILAPFDDEMAKMLQNELVRKGVHIHFGTSVQKFENEGKKIVLTNGHTFETDMVIMSIGVIPETHLAKEAGLELGELGGIKVNEYNQTSNPDIYAGGDAIEVEHFVTKKQAKIPLAWPANRHGRIISDHIAGKLNAYAGSQGTSVLKVFDYIGASTGINEKQAKQLGLDYQTFHIHRSNHAGYYPGSKDITLKVLFDTKTLKILGAQAVGQSGTDKRIDVIATAMHFNATVLDLQELELTYAPPISSAKDPVNILGYVADNIIDGKFKPFYVQDVNALNMQGVQLIDVRTPAEFAAGHIENAVNIPVDDLGKRIEEVDFTKPAYLICRVGLRGYIASTILNAHGFKQEMYNLSGGQLLLDYYTE